MIEISVENKLLLLLCDKKPSQSREEIISLILEPIDWYSFFSIAMKHKVLFICFEKLRDLELLNFSLKEGNLSLLMLNHWEQLYEVNTYKNKKYMEELNKINYAFSDAGINYAIAKGGPALIGKVYTISERKMYDIDLIANKKDYQKLDNTLKLLGYFNANYNHDKKEYLPVSQEEIRKWFLHTRGLPNYVKPVDSIIRQVLLQIQFKIGSTITGETIDAAKLIQDSKKENENLSVISPEDLAIQLALHLYRETIEPSFEAWNMDWNLIKICDFDRYINYYNENNVISNLINRIEELDCVKPFLYSTYFTNLVYPTPVLKKVIDLLVNKSEENFIENLFERKNILGEIFKLGEGDKKNESEWEKLMGIKTL
ncbi:MULTISPECIES: nucleotidyltransferase family protein [Bacillus]|uniref:nucleotidyltransferase family protein n=1 Tax=Bacillus TaxID=1386 RepID=UPI0020CF7975|nr:nucleotidyltransferase family protein [Bacillus safensis]MCP9282872.1 nucleotidyltransferase family protein [Bacillus safensis]